MNEKLSARPATAFPGQAVALYLSGALLLALFLALALTWQDHARRTSLESTTETTSVGDTHLFLLPNSSPRPPYLSVASFQGQPLYPTDYEPHRFHPDDMIRVGVDDRAGYLLYRAPVPEKLGGEHPLGPLYYLKLSANEFLQTQPSSPRLLSMGGEAPRSFSAANSSKEAGEAKLLRYSCHPLLYGSIILSTS